MRRTQLSAVLLVSALNGLPSAQQATDVSGTWVATTETVAGFSVAPSPVFGPRFALRQRGDDLTVVRLIRDAPFAMPFVLDGRETRFRVPGGLCQADSETIETAVREGDAIAMAIVGSVPAGGGSIIKRDIRRTFRRTSPDTLVVEGRMAMQGKLQPVATLYRRSSEEMAAPAVASGAKTPGSIEQVSWLAGVWSGTAGQTTVEERWTPPSGGSMLAVARTLRSGTMSSFEFLCIAERDGGLVYTAMPNGRTPPTHFTLTSMSADAATFENPAHDFPKLIRYTKRPDGTLETMVAGEGGQKPQTVVLQRQE